MGSIPEQTASTSQRTVATDFLIVGAGPAGASLACFLGRLGLKGIVISAANGPAKTPRAHLTNPPALECLRDLDHSVYDECLRLGNGDQYIEHYRWCETLAGEEYARNQAWGINERKGEFEAVSPCKYMDLTQNLLEPVLLKYASNNGFLVRFDTKLVTFEEGEEDENRRKISVTVEDLISGFRYDIRAKHLFGADGGRSTVTKILDLPLSSLPGGGFAYNVLVRTDPLDHLMQYQQGNLHVCLRLLKNHPFIAVARMVKPWTEWMFVFFPKGPDAPNPKRSFQEWAELAVDLIGDPSVKVEVQDVSGWMINETSADVISKGNVYCLGDAIHRHPPTGGLGSNTCIQDAFNLAWKIAMVEKNLAHPSLLSTYNTERQPVAAHLVTESNDILRLSFPLWGALGLQPYGVSEEEMQMNRRGLSSNTTEGRERRKAIRAGTKSLQQEQGGLGTAMGQRYESFAVYNQEEEPFKPGPRETTDPRQQYDPSTYPGRRLPHAWLGKQVAGPLVSTLDVAGKGQFTLFTGIGGDGWKVAASAVQDNLAVSIKVVGIGYDLDWQDMYFKWAEVCGIEEDGCVLVRPDYFVAWRAQNSGDEAERLIKVMGSILGFSTSASAKSSVVTPVKPTNGVKE